MANRIYNKQVSPKGYKRGGGVTGVKAKQEMAARPKRKATTKKFLKTAGKILFPPAAAADAGFKLAKRFKKMGGGMMMKRPMMKEGGKVKKGKKVKPLRKSPKPGTYDYYLLNRPKHSPAPIKPKSKG